MHAMDAARSDQVRRAAGQMHVGLAAGLMPHADQSPWDSVPEGFARRLFGREGAGQSLLRVAVALGVRYLFGRENFLRKLFQLHRCESKTLDVSDIGAKSDDHRLCFRTTASCMPEDLHPAG